jgi:hypothetical protein
MLRTDTQRPQDATDRLAFDIELGFPVDSQGCLSLDFNGAM